MLDLSVTVNGTCLSTSSLVFQLTSYLSGLRGFAFFVLSLVFSLFFFSSRLFFVLSLVFSLFFFSSRLFFVLSLVFSLFFFSSRLFFVLSLVFSLFFFSSRLFRSHPKLARHAGNRQEKQTTMMHAQPEETH